MSEHPTTYSNFWVFRADREWRRLSVDAKDAARTELAGIVERAASEGITLRGSYSTVGLRHDADLILWVIAPEVEALQRLAVNINATTLGQYLEPRYTFLGVALASRYTADHAPAFVRGVPPKRYLSVYPFVKTHEWYQLSFEKRREAMAEHGRLGREFPDILTNTVSAYGIADHEFVVAFEADDVAEMVRMVEHLRPAASRPYTAWDTPILLGVRKELAEVLDDLG